MRANHKLAQQLKEAGYDVPTTHYYNTEKDYGIRNGELYDFNRYHNAVSAPTLNDITDWLREVKGVHVTTSPHVDYLPNQFIYEIYKLHKEDWRLHDGCSGFKTHDTALTAGIEAALEILKNDKK